MDAGGRRRSGTKQPRLFWLCALFAALLLSVRAQTPPSLGPFNLVSYDLGSGFISQVMPCRQPVDDLPAALCWVMRAGEIHTVDGKLQASKLKIGYLSISAERVFFRPEERGAVIIDFAPALVKVVHAAGRPYAVLTSGGQSFVIAALAVCPSCPGDALYTIPASLNFEDEYADLAASLQQFDVVLKRITALAAQPPKQHRPAALPNVDSDKHVVSRIEPEYPAVAKAARIQGTVVIQAIISKEGGVSDAEVVSGPELLRGAALTAVEQWKYKPYLLNGAPVEVSTRINVSFMLGPSELAGRPLDP